MKKNIDMDILEDIKKTKYDIICKKCGWRNRLCYSEKVVKTKKICKKCGNYVFINDKEEFLYRLNEAKYK